MPKVYDTRKQRAIELLERLRRGPAHLEQSTPLESYQLWAESWIVPELKKLIPELKEKKR